MFASYHGHPAVVKVLLEANCELNAVGTNGWSALHWAADRNRKDVVEILLDSGIDYMLKGRRDDFAVDRAKDKGVKNIIIAAMGDKYDPSHQIKEPIAGTPNDVNKTTPGDFVKRMLLPNGVPAAPQPRTPRKRREIPMVSALGAPPPPPEKIVEKPVETLQQAWDAIPMADDESDDEINPSRSPKVKAEEIESNGKDTFEEDSDSGVDTPSESSAKKESTTDSESKMPETPESESESYPQLSESLSSPSENMTPGSEIADAAIASSEKSEVLDESEKVPNGTPEVETPITDNGSSSCDVEILPLEGKMAAATDAIVSADSLDDILANNIDEISLGEI